MQSKVCERSDIVITTAQLFGRPFPKIIDSNTILKMKRGSVILDMAVESGGNVEGSKVDEVAISMSESCRDFKSFITSSYTCLICAFQ